jgi:hypothetical protein
MNTYPGHECTKKHAEEPRSLAEIMGASVRPAVRTRRANKRVGSGEFVRVPRRIIEAILSEAAHKHADILTETSWNLGYGVACTLKVAELRQLNTCLHNLHLNPQRRGKVAP